MVVLDRAFFRVSDDFNRGLHCMLDVKPEPAPPELKSWPFALVYRIHAIARRAVGSLQAGAPLDVRAAGLESGLVRIGLGVWNGLADMPLRYLRQQRSGFNPVYNTTVHTKDGIIVDHPTRAGEAIPATGGWADASDYLQYVKRLIPSWALLGHRYFLREPVTDAGRLFGEGGLASGGSPYVALAVKQLERDTDWASIREQLRRCQVHSESVL